MILMRPVPETGCRT